MTTTTIILAITLIVGFYMAWNIGANDTANSMSTAVGAKALTLKQAVCLNGFFCLIGAVLVGSHCTDTVRKGIVDPHLMGNPQTAMIGFFCVVVAASVWVTFATWRELPVSTTHSVVGAVMGVGIVSGGIGAVHWTKVWGIVASWVISPLFSGILAF
jgi:PiT family inorganic phosphate transporter